MQKHVEIDEYKFCRDDKTGYYLSTSRINGKRKRLHIYIWEKHNGAIPSGFHIHHKDKNKYNNSIENLELIDGSKHLSLHCQDRIEELRENCIKNAHPAAKIWHGSEEGRAWHRTHAREVADKVFAEKTLELTCKHCGEKFLTYEALSTRHDFCSNKCKSAWRRKLGVDNEERICAHCGDTFSVSKYSDAECCSKSCGIKRSWAKKREDKVN